MKELKAITITHRRNLSRAEGVKQCKDTKLIWMRFKFERRENK